MRRGHAALLLLAVSWLACASGAKGRRTVVYLNNWSQYWPGTCAKQPKDFPADLATHINYAFVFMNKSFAPKLLDPNDTVFFGQLRKLRRQNPELKLMLSMGGWTMNEAGSGYETLFSEAVATKANRTRFIRNTMRFCESYGFDGLDLDWEYPGDESRGGRPEDYVNFPKLLKEYRQAIDSSMRPFLLTMAAGAGPGGYKGLDLPNIHPHLDFINLMTYDYKGQWEKDVGFQTPWAAQAPGALSITDTLSHFLDAGVPPEKLSLGLALYGRSWTLADPLSNMPGAAATEGGRPGACSGETGYLAYSELQPAIKSGVPVVTNNTMKAAYLVAGDQWVSFDTLTTLGWKMQAAERLGLGGFMVWEGDLDDPEHTLLKRIKQGAPARKPCGEGRIGTGRCSDKSLCCSKWGYCGSGQEYCGLTNCLGGPCEVGNIDPATIKVVCNGTKALC